MNKYIFTFGSSFLSEIKHLVDPMKVMLVVEEESEAEARAKVMDSFIGDKFCTSYYYEDKVIEFKEKYNMKEYSLPQLKAMKDNLTYLPEYDAYVQVEDNHIYTVPAFIDLDYDLEELLEVTAPEEDFLKIVNDKFGTSFSMSDFAGR